MVKYIFHFTVLSLHQTQDSIRDRILQFNQQEQASSSFEKDQLKYYR